MAVEVAADAAEVVVEVAEVEVLEEVGAVVLEEVVSEEAVDLDQVLTPITTGITRIVMVLIHITTIATMVDLVLA